MEKDLITQELEVEKDLVTQELEVGKWNWRWLHKSWKFRKILVTQKLLAPEDLRNGKFHTNIEKKIPCSNNIAG